MKVIETQRGFRRIMYNSYSNEPKPELLIGESSAIGDYDDAYNNPGSSYLWVGEHHHLNRDEVKMMIQKMQNWIDGKRLF